VEERVCLENGHFAVEGGEGVSRRGVEDVSRRQEVVGGDLGGVTEELVAQIDEGGEEVGTVDTGRWDAVEDELPDVLAETGAEIEENRAVVGFVLCWRGEECREDVRLVEGMVGEREHGEAE